MQNRFAGLCGLAILAAALAGCSDETDAPGTENTATACQDGKDNDGNGLTDCKDPACGQQTYCKATPGCGDGVVTAPERCDTKIAAGASGVCPTSCDDSNACTKDELTGGGTCDATCTATPITECTAGDGCCPTGCDSTMDSDCSPTCGNGVLDPKEACDTKIAAGQPGACPTTCDDGKACTKDQLLNGGTCSASCTNQTIALCDLKSDGCCPAGCDSTTDADCSPACGNGVVDPKETCDTKIAAGQTGVCPTSCEDGKACTKDELQNGGTCTAACLNSPISQCSMTSDGCCPAACTPATDVDCTVSCGNGVVDPPELCDTKIAAGETGACPTSCDDKQVCTTDTLLNGGTCSASCTNLAITECKNGDGCCPAGCNSKNDGDCAPVCGNGVLETGEVCDTKIAAGQAGACVTACDDGKACTVDALNGAGTCSASCAFAAVTACKNADGCCPIGCTSITDSDCTAVCGNGIHEVTSETCDTAIAAGQPGACPVEADCDDKNACTSDLLYGKGTCQSACIATPITACSAVSEGCCPPGCHALNDADCQPVCGNGILEPPEKCDSAIAAGQPGACPTACNDGSPCTTDALVGTACTTECAATPVAGCWEVSTDAMVSWTAVTLPNTNWGCSYCDRYYRTYVTGKPTDVSFKFSSDNTARMLVNGAVVFDQYFNLASWCTTAACCAMCCDSTANCLAHLSATFALGAPQLANFTTGTNAIVWQVHQEWGGSGFHTTMTVTP